MEFLEGRLALSTASAAVVASTPEQVGNTLAVLTAFTKAYQSHPGEANYDPALDLNHNHQIAQVDGKLLLRTLPALSPKIPLGLAVALAPRDTVHGHHSTNSGGYTYDQTPTVVGHTTPGALVFTGLGTLDLKLRGPAYVADAQGNFSFPFKNTDGINQLDLLAVDAYGQQTLRAFPVFWAGFAAYEAAHPMNT